MNKLIIVDDQIKEQIIDHTTEVNMTLKNELFDVNTLKINFIKDTILEIEYSSEKELKYDIYITLNSNVNVTIKEKRNGAKNKIQYKYLLNDHSHLTVNRFYDVISIRQLEIINLNGKNAQIDYNFKTISKDEEKYEIIVNHDDIETISNIDNRAVNILNGKITFNVTSTVFSGIKNCVINQTGRIINLNDNACIINPNLLIEDNDVIANHSAFIGKFKDEEIFYLMSRGITYDNAIKLLIKGFLTDQENDDYIASVIGKYWR